MCTIGVRAYVDAVPGNEFRIWESGRLILRLATRVFKDTWS